VPVPVLPVCVCTRFIHDDDDEDNAEQVVMAGIITQVSQTPVQANIHPPLLTRLSLDLRGKRFSVDRETIMNLPESVLLCLFPNGLVLSRQATSLTEPGEHAEEEEVYGVDVRWRLCSFLLSSALIRRL
jgi:hypothetical protein